MPAARIRSTLASLAVAGGTPLTDDDWRILSAAVGDLSEAEKRRAEGLMRVFGRGFVVLASNGHEFVPADRIAERFGDTLRANYPEANDVFLAFATSYWTFKLWMGDVEDEVDQAPVAAGLVATLEEQIGSLFFPTPGPVRVPPGRREATQRQFLAEYGAQFDVDAFVKGNPILVRDRRSGCLGAAAVLVGSVILVRLVASGLTAL